MMTVRDASVWTLVTVLFATVPVAASGVASSPVDAKGVRPSVAPTPASLDVDRLVASAVGRAVLLQRTRSRPTSGSGNNTMRWVVGLGMLGLGGLLAFHGAVSTCGAQFSAAGSPLGVELSVDTSACWGRAGVGAGIAAAGFFVMLR